MSRRELMTCVVAVVTAMGWNSTSLWAAPAAGIPAQPGDDASELLVPIRPRTPEVQNRLEAVSWYTTGRLLESRGKTKQALDAYRKAVQLDPSAIEVYRALVPLAMQLDDLDEAIRLGVKAVELDPEDYELQLQIGVQFARQQDFAAGIKYLEMALKSSKLEKESPTSVMLHLELAVLYQVTAQLQKAADNYALVFDAIKNPAKYSLEFRARSALVNDPRASYERMGQVFMEGERLELAKEAFDLAAKSNRISAGNLLYHRARLLLLSGKGEEALAELQKYLDEQRQSKGRAAYELLGEILKKLDRSDELVGRLEALAEQDPRNKQLQYFFADSLMNAGDLDRAKKVYETALEGSGDAPGYLGLAGVLRRMKRADELLDVLGRGLSKLGDEGLQQFDAELKAVVADPPMVDALLAAGRAQHQAEPPQLSFEESYLLGKVAAEIDRFDDAIEFLRLAATLDKERAVLAYRDLAELLFDGQRYAEAATAYADALELRLPQQLQAQFRFGLAQARELAGDTAGALQAVNEAKQEFPGVPLFDYQEGWIYYHSRQFDKAVEHFEQVIENFSDNKEIVRRCQFSLSAIYVTLGDIPKGEKILETVYAEEPDNINVNNDLGYLYADQGKKLEQAEKMIRKAVAAEPDNAAYLDSLGWVLFKLGKFKEALDPLEQATKKETGGDSTIWDHLGDCYQSLSRLPDAKVSWEKALKKAEEEKYPDAKLIEKIKAKLKDQAGVATSPKPATPNNP